MIDYAADLEAMDLAELAGPLARESGKRGIDEIEDLEQCFAQRFGEQELTSLRPLRTFLVGLGAHESVGSRAARGLHTTHRERC